MIGVLRGELDSFSLGWVVAPGALEELVKVDEAPLEVPLVVVDVPEVVDPAGAVCVLEAAVPAVLDVPEVPPEVPPGANAGTHDMLDVSRAYV
jgi:hypothetical protein